MENSNIPADVLSQLYFLKPVLNAKEALRYLGISKSKLYKATSGGLISFYKPNDGKLFFKREDLDAYALKNRHASIDEINSKAANQFS